MAVGENLFNESIKRLQEGNSRFVSGKVQHPNQDIKRRKEVVAGQKPFAIVLGCADSRVPPEDIFDQGIGDIFTIRVAGNVLNDDNIASIEYAVEHLDVPLVVILGHGKCGAVTAAASGAHLPGHVAGLAKKIETAIAGVKAGPDGKKNIEECIDENARFVAASLAKSEPIISEMVRDHKIKIVAAKYNLDSGEVEFFKDSF